MSAEKILKVMLISLEARQKVASSYLFNNNMAIESSLLEKQIQALKIYKKKSVLSLLNFKALLKDFERCAISHAESGGGYPEDIPLKEEDYNESRKELIDFIERLL